MTPLRTSEVAAALGSPRARVAAAGMESVPPPEIVPPVQLMEPLTVSAPEVLNVPPPIARLPDIAQLEAIASKPFERSRVASLAEIVRLLTESEAVNECVTVIPEMSIIASSDGPGSTPLLQLAGVSQSPPAGLTQVSVARRVRASRASTAGRKPRRLVRRGVGSLVCGERSNVRRMGASPGLKTLMKDQIRKSSTSARRASARACQAPLLKKAAIGKDGRRPQILESHCRLRFSRTGLGGEPP